MKKDDVRDVTAVMSSLRKLDLVTREGIDSTARYALTFHGLHFLSSPTVDVLVDRLLSLPRYRYLYELFHSYGKLDRKQALELMRLKWPSYSPQSLNMAINWLRELRLIEKVHKGYRALADQASSYIGSFDQVVTHPRIRAAAEPLFRKGVFSAAVHDALQIVVKAVKEKTGVRNIRGDAELMKYVFSASNPLLVLNDPSDHPGRGYQEGVMNLMAGVYSVFRNPRTHSVNGAGDPQETLRLLGLTCLMMELVEESALQIQEG